MPKTVKTAVVKSAAALSPGKETTPRASGPLQGCKVGNDADGFYAVKGDIRTSSHPTPAAIPHKAVTAVRANGK